MKSLHLLFVLVLGVFLSGVRQRALGYSDCGDDDIFGLEGHCGNSVWVGETAVEPSPDCCHFATERTSLACICQYVVTPDTEKRISMSKLAHVASYCGAPLKPGTVCGSYTVPPQP